MVPLNHRDADARAWGGTQFAAEENGWWVVVGNVIKFPTEGRIVRFGRDAAESATIIILPVIRIERYMDPKAEQAEPQTHPPAQNGGRRRLRRR